MTCKGILVIGTIVPIYKGRHRFSDVKELAQSPIFSIQQVGHLPPNNAFSSTKSEQCLL